LPGWHRCLRPAAPQHCPWTTRGAGTTWWWSWWWSFERGHDDGLRSAKKSLWSIGCRCECAGLARAVMCADRWASQGRQGAYRPAFNPAVRRDEEYGREPFGGAAGATCGRDMETPQRRGQQAATERYSGCRWCNYFAEGTGRFGRATNEYGASVRRSEGSRFGFARKKVRGRGQRELRVTTVG